MMGPDGRQTMKNPGILTALAIVCMSLVSHTGAVLARPTAPAVNESPMTGGHPQRTLLSLRFDDVDIAQVMAAIAKQGNVGIAVRNDLGGKIRGVRLTNVTPEQAIRCIAAATNLEWRKLDDKTYLIVKMLPIAENDEGREQPLPGQTPPTQSPPVDESPDQERIRRFSSPQSPSSVTRIQNGIKVISPNPQIEYKLYVGPVNSNVDPEMVVNPIKPEIPPMPDILHGIPVLPRIPALPGVPPAK
jgi:hypothetical protein